MTGGGQVDNVYVIDTKMFGFDQYCSAFIVAGKEIALIDTGAATSADAVRDGIKAHGFLKYVVKRDVNGAVVADTYTPSPTSYAAATSLMSPGTTNTTFSIGQTFLAGPRNFMRNWNQILNTKNGSLKE